MIKIENVTKKYKMGHEDVVALKDVSLSVEDGEFVTLVGPSGSGKSTLMHIIGGLDRPDEGSVQVGDFEISNPKVKENDMSEFRNKKIGFVFQTFNLEHTLSALENVQMPLLFSGMSSKESLALARLALRKVGLQDRMDHRPSELSGGQRQRVSIARAIVNEPDIILADEPTGNLDTKTGQKIIKLLKDINKTEGTTVIIVTHDLGIAEKAKRVVMIQDGEIRNN
ncbi:ABC transporter ATP-binding protein [Candidatus Dojkabacteria bacterium]|uniref:ABC transporter ATP-binding protein n=1 Tax=Candidatus Dojkabacteria bacterium TaxID=2099670 RepID=A0A955L3Q5_9BACT|nr:ABC transporter ATP-binding protein [Candidatus Dojkabacteria bacterium]